MQKRDDFDDPDLSGSFDRILNAIDRSGQIRARKPLFVVLLLGGLVLLLVSVLWYSYPRESERRAISAAPIIRADATPYKMPPDDPGGMTIPFRESTIFNSLRGADQGARIESLLPRAEEPVDRDQLFAGLKTTIESDTLASAPVQTEPEPEPVAAIEAEPDAAPAPAPSTQAPAASQASPQATPPVTPQAKPVREDAAAPQPAVEPAAGADTSRTAPSQGGTHFVQLASLTSRGDADAAWKALQKQFSGLLDTQSYRVQEASLDSGTFYRVQAGPLSEDAARSLCRSIEARKPGGCLVVRR